MATKRQKVPVGPFRVLAFSPNPVSHVFRQSSELHWSQRLSQPNLFVETGQRPTSHNVVALKSDVKTPRDMKRRTSRVALLLGEALGLDDLEADVGEFEEERLPHGGADVTLHVT